MNKNIIALIITIIVVILLAVGFGVYNNKNNRTQNEIDNTIQENETEPKDNMAENNTVTNNKKILVVYFSAQNHTKTVAEKIAKNLNADIFEIVPEEEYTAEDLNWNDSNSRVSREHENESLKDVKLKNTSVENWENYDTVIIGYPIWWGSAAWPVNSFVKANNFDGKTVIPFCTSSSSGLGQSGNLLQEEAKTGNWLDGHRFSSNASDSDIQKWTDNLKNIF